MDSILIQDVCEVYLKELGGDNKEYFYGLTTSSAVNQSISQESLRAGIGNGVVGVIQSEKEITFSVATLLHNDGLFEIQNGENFASEVEMTVVDTYKGTATSTTVITLDESVRGEAGAILVTDSKGKKVEGTFTVSTDKATVTGGTVELGENYNVHVTATVEGEVLTLRSKKFPKNYHVQLHTIAYDVESNQVVADIYWIFKKALPNGALSGNYEAGSNSGNEIEFTAQLSGSDIYGQYVVVARP